MTVKGPWLNNEQVGELLGVSMSFASYLRNGQRSPGPETQLAMVENLGADPSELLLAINAMKRDDPSLFVALLDRLTEVRSVRRWERKKQRRAARQAANA